jgi:hypothetical protein
VRRVKLNKARRAAIEKIGRYSSLIFFYEAIGMSFILVKILSTTERYSEKEKDKRQQPHGKRGINNTRVVVDQKMNEPSPNGSNYKPGFKLDKPKLKSKDSKSQNGPFRGRRMAKNGTQNS